MGQLASLPNHGRRCRRGISRGQTWIQLRRTTARVLQRCSRPSLLLTAPGSGVALSVSKVVADLFGFVPRKDVTVRIARPDCVVPPPPPPSLPFFSRRLPLRTLRPLRSSSRTSSSPAASFGSSATAFLAFLFLEQSPSCGLAYGSSLYPPSVTRFIGNSPRRQTPHHPPPAQRRLPSPRLRPRRGGARPLRTRHPPHARRLPLAQRQIHVARPSAPNPKPNPTPPQVSDELFHFDDAGRHFTNKAVDGFMSVCLRRWADLGVDHLLQVVLFARTVSCVGGRGVVWRLGGVRVAPRVSRSPPPPALSDFFPPEWTGRTIARRTSTKCLLLLYFLTQRLFIKGTS